MSRPPDTDQDKLKRTLRPSSWTWSDRCLIPLGNLDGSATGAPVDSSRAGACQPDMKQIKRGIHERRVSIAHNRPSLCLHEKDLSLHEP